MLKKIMEVVLAVCLCVGCLPLSAGASGNFLSDDQEKLKNFLTQFAQSGLNEFDYHKASDCVVSYGRRNTILTALVNELPVSVCDFSIYPGEQPTSFSSLFNKLDPLQKWNGYVKYPMETVNWVLSNIFNCSQKNIEEMNDSFSEIKKENGYILNGYYYVRWGGVGTGTSIEISKMKSIGQKYQVIYYVRHYDSPPEKNYAIVELKNIDGNEYWSLYFNTRLQYNVDPIAMGGFVDVAIDSYYATSVLWAVENGITSGTGTATFGPDQSCTRAQAVTFLWNAAGKPEPQGNYSLFTDVSPTDWYYKAVLWAVENDITSGIGNGQFNPSGICSRGQIVTLLWRAKGQPFAGNTSSFVDVAKGAYYENAVSWAVENGITTGVGNGRFNPEGTCTRGQIVTFLHRNK